MGTRNRPLNGVDPETARVDIDDVFADVDSLLQHPDEMQPLVAGGGIGVRAPKPFDTWVGIKDADAVRTFVNLDAGVIVGVLEFDDDNSPPHPGP